MMIRAMVALGAVLGGWAMAVPAQAEVNFRQGALTFTGDEVQLQLQLPAEDSYGPWSAEEKRQLHRFQVSAAQGSYHVELLVNRASDGGTDTAHRCDRYRTIDHTTCASLDPSTYATATLDVAGDRRYLSIHRQLDSGDTIKVVHAAANAAPSRAELEADFQRVAAIVNSLRVRPLRSHHSEVTLGVEGSAPLRP